MTSDRVYMTFAWGSGTSSLVHMTPRTVPVASWGVHIYYIVEGPSDIGPLGEICDHREGLCDLVWCVCNLGVGVCGYVEIISDLGMVAVTSGSVSVTTRMVSMTT